MYSLYYNGGRENQVEDLILVRALMTSEEKNVVIYQISASWQKKFILNVCTHACIYMYVYIHKHTHG